MPALGRFRARRTAARGLAVLAVWLVACASSTPAPAPAGGASLSGQLRLVPREGVTPVKAGGSAYADRRMRDVTFVDYPKPGFAVAYLNDDTSPGGKAELVIHATGVRTRLDPEHAALGRGGVLVVKNESTSTHVLSVPALGLLRRIGAGEQAELELTAAGEQSVFLLDVPQCEAVVFVAPGPYSVVGSDGRFALHGLAPGKRELIAWHPRFPAAHAVVEIAAQGAVQRDLEMSVEQITEKHDAAPADHP